MKNQYWVQFKQWYVVALWAMSMAMSARAQTVQPPVIQWQRVLEPVIPGGANGRSAIIKNSQGGYSLVTADQRLVSLTAAGDVLSDTPLTDISVTGITNRVLSAISPVSTSDGAIAIGVLSQAEGWKLQKRNISGEIIWTSSVPYSVPSRDYQYQVSSVVTSLNGDYFVFATRSDNTYADPLTPIATYVIIARYNSAGYFLDDQVLRYSSVTNSLTYINSTRVNKAIKTPDGGFLLVGLANPTSSNNTLRGWAAKLSAQGNVVWQNRYEFMNTIDDAAVSTTGAYLLSGSAIATPAGLYSSSTLRVDALGNSGGSTPVLVPYPAFNSLSSITSTPSGYIIGNDTSPNTNNGDIRLTSFSEQGAILWTKTIGGSGRDFNFTPDVLITNDGYVVAGQTASTDGDIKGKQTSNVATWIVKLQNPANILTLTQPTYNCQNGAITFNTTGGDGSAISYITPGITRASATDNFGIVEAGLRGDPKPIVIQATQSGQTVSYTFDLGLSSLNCTYGFKPPIQVKPIPDLTFTVGQLVTYSDFTLNDYFVDPSNKPPHYFSNWAATLKGLPNGLFQYTANGGDLRTTLDVYLQGSPTITGVYTVTATVSLSRFLDQPLTTTFKINVITGSVVNPPTGGALTLTPPTYNCSTGAITFNTTGGNGSPITYTAPGISRARITDNFGTVEAGLQGDPKPITITATQSGQTVSYSFDFGAFCSGNQPPQPPVTPPTAGAITLLAPTYDCGSGAFTFKSSGGDGSPIEYMAIGITAWTTNPNQFVDRESRTANDVKPFTLMARQNGQTVTYTWDLKAACGRANSRLQAAQTDNPLTLTVLGNPVHEQLRVQVRGGSGQPVLLQLTDLTGRSIESRTVSIVDDTQEQVFELGQQGAGLLLLRANNGTQQRSVKVVKQ